jgi:hypothetical protein
MQLSGKGVRENANLQCRRTKQSYLKQLLSASSDSDVDHCAVINFFFILFQHTTRPKITREDNAEHTGFYSLRLPAERLTFTQGSL